ncbi:hypothetical protein FJT64_004283 [Amphibalanus amphitrite]|uniref:Uncharacterized protein n=1 Tax=Amphibalanus amphitrite TaxID=1232801 RepID=A0A6A4VZJ7_AMPAM|nr:hypothetical protein FJT64_004283 [Amphibalanus amphitrite]
MWKPRVTQTQTRVRDATLHDADETCELDVEPEGPVEEGQPEDAEEEPEQRSGAASDRHWPTRSALVSEPELLTLVREIDVQCRKCGSACAPRLKRVALSFRVDWVRTEDKALLC